MHQASTPIGFTHTRSVRVEWGHCDSAGIVFHPRYIEYFDWSCALLVEATRGMTHQELTAHYCFSAIPIVNLECDFKHPVRHGETIAITSEVVDVGTSSFTVVMTVRLNGRIAATCKQKRVWCIDDPARPGNLKSAPIPEEFLQAWRCNVTA